MRQNQPKEKSVIDILEDFMSNVLSFFKKIFRQNKVTLPLKSTVYIGNDQWKIFLSFISSATKDIKILTGSISYDALSLIFSRIQKDVTVKIITGRGRDYEKIFKMKAIGGKENIKRCKRLHAKLCIIDGKRMLIGSSNITKSSLGDNLGRYGFLEADAIVENSHIIKNGEDLFDILWNEKGNIDLLQRDTDFISSAYGVPLKIKELVQNAKEEIVIIVPPLFRRSTSNFKSIAKYIRDLKPDIKMKIITSHRINEQYIDGLEEIQKFDNTEIRLVRDRIHAKIYIFDWKTAIISSVNLYFPQWVSSLESGIIITNNEIIERIRKKVYKLELNIKSLEIDINKGSSADGFYDELIEKMEFYFETEGKKILPELRVHKEIHKAESKREGASTIDEDVTPRKIKKPCEKRVVPKIIEIPPEIIKERAIEKEKTIEKLEKERDRLISKLDEYYSKSRDISIKKDETYKKAMALKNKRNSLQSKLRELKSKRQDLLERKISESSNENEINGLKLQVDESHEESCAVFRQYDLYRGELKSQAEKIRNVKKRINQINIKISKLAGSFEREGTVIIDDLFEYLLMCPYSNYKEIKMYILDFATEYGIYLDINYLFQTFQLSFGTKNLEANTGKIYNLLSIFSKGFEYRFKESLPRFFKNVILDMGESGLSVKSKEEYENFEREFRQFFGINPPERKEVLEAIYNHEKALEKIARSDIHYNKIWNIFQKEYPDIFKKLEQKLADIREEMPRDRMNLKILVQYLEEEKILENLDKLKELTLGEKLRLIEGIRFGILPDDFKKLETEIDIPQRKSRTLTEEEIIEHLDDARKNKPYLAYIEVLSRYDEEVSRDVLITEIQKSLGNEVFDVNKLIGILAGMIARNEIENGIERFDEVSRNRETFKLKDRYGGLVLLEIIRNYISKCHLKEPMNQEKRT